MSKGLKALEKLANYKCSSMSEKIECKEIIEKELKALEIIKEKRVDVELLMKTESAKDYNKYSKNVNQSHNLGQRQYDFLKEVLL